MVTNFRILTVSTVPGGSSVQQDFQKQLSNEMLAQWQNRNTDMVHNVVERARKTGANRVVVFVGANHRNIMHDGLTNTPNVTAYELSSLK